MLVGGGELVARYRDAPERALATTAAWLYVVINVGASLSALALIEAFDWRFGLDDATAQLRWTRVLVAGFGSMALFRSALFVVRVGTEDVGVGPSSLLGALLRATDRQVDRVRGQARAKEIREILEKVPWSQAREDLPALCLGLMQNTTLTEKEDLAATIRDLDAGDLDDDVRVYLVGLALSNLAGVGVLRGAVSLLPPVSGVP